MRRKNKKLIFSILGLIIAAAVAVTSTYAWLSMNSTSTIEGFNIDIGNNRKLLISFTGEEGSYKAYMTSADTGLSCREIRRGFLALSRSVGRWHSHIRPWRRRGELYIL